MANERLSDLSVGGAIASTDLFYSVETAGVGGVSKDGADFAEYIRDIYNASIQDSATVEKTENDPADTISFSIVDGSVDTTQLANGGVTYAKLQDASAGFTVVAKADTGSGSYAELAAGDNGVLRRSGSGDLEFGTLVTGNIGDDQVTYTKIQNVSATDRLLGRSTAGAGVVEEIPCTAAGRALLDDANAAAQRTTLGLGTAAVEGYTVGSWTPVANFVTPGTSSFSYATQSGFYRAIGGAGGFVEVFFSLAFTPTIGTGSGSFYITGLPFSINTGLALYGSGIPAFMDSDWSWPSGYTAVSLGAISSFNGIDLRFNGDGVTSVIANTTNMTDGSQHNLAGYLIYRRA